MLLHGCRTLVVEYRPAGLLPGCQFDVDDYSLVLLPRDQGRCSRWRYSDRNAAARMPNASSRIPTSRIVARLSIRCRRLLISTPPERSGSMQPVAVYRSECCCTDAER